MLDTFIRFFQEGGFFMYPIAVVLIIGLAIAIERFWFLSGAQRSNQKIFDKSLLPLLKDGDFVSAAKQARDSGTAIGALVSTGLARHLNHADRDDVEYAMEESLMEALPRLEKRTQYLATLANVSTLLGLLGTIIGLIAAFTAVANADPAEKASLLSQSISVAMNTTAFGLMAAIPLLLIHATLQTKTNEIVDRLEMAGIKVLNLLSDSRG